MLLSMTFGRNAHPYMRKRYNDYLNHLEAGAKDELNFYERQEIDLIVKQGKEITIKQIQETALKEK